MGATGIVDNAGSGFLWSTFAHERYYRYAIPLWRNALQQLAIGCNSTTERLRSAIGMLPTIDYEQTSTACGHGTIALGVWAVHTGRVALDRSGITDVVVDVPSGRVTARLHSKDDHITGVDFVNVPS